MKNGLKIVLMTVTAAVSAAAFAGCGYTPDENSYYYDNGETYRVIELDDTKTLEIEEYAIISIQIPVVGAANVTPYSYIISPNTLFFDAADGLTRAAAECVYSYFRFNNADKLEAKAVYFPWSGLCCFENLRRASESNLGGNKTYEGGDIIGSYIDKATRYTFNYTDYSKKDGEAVNSGSFCVLRSMGYSTVSKFSYDEFTDLYSVKGAGNG